MIDITARAEGYWLSLRLTPEQRADQQLKSVVIDAFEQGYMAHDHHVGSAASTS